MFLLDQLLYSQDHFGTSTLSLILSLRTCIHSIKEKMRFLKFALFSRDGWTDERTVGRTDGRTDGRTVGRSHVVRSNGPILRTRTTFFRRQTCIHASSIFKIPLTECATGAKPNFINHCDHLPTTSSRGFLTPPSCSLTHRFPSLTEYTKSLNARGTDSQIEIAVPKCLPPYDMY